MRQIRPTEALIDVSAAVENYRLANELGNHPGIAIVKANAYGHGAVPISQALVDAGAPMLGVVTVEEGIELREAGIKVPILVFGGAYGKRYDVMLEYGLTPIIFSREHLEECARSARRAESSWRVHVKVDTGMGRLGILPAELPDLLALARQRPEVVIEGACTHYANSDDLELVTHQRRIFSEALEQLRAAGCPVRIRHISNSGALLNRFAGNEEELSRPGLMLYGYPPFTPVPGTEGARNSSGLKKVLSWRTTIVHLKAIPAGTPISYSARWISKRPSRIATLPVGYVDGFDRRLTGSDRPGFANGQVLCGGRRVPVVGTVCMDLCMIDVTDVPEAAVGSEVVLLGRQGDESIDADELAERTGTVCLQILSSISARVPRIFLRGASGI